MSRLHWFGLAAVCLGVAVGFIPVYSTILQWKAESLIRNVSTLYQSPGKAPAISTVQALYKGELTQKGCTPDYCVYEVVVSNRILAALHWAPYTELRSEFWVQNGVVVTNALDYTSSANQLHSIVSHVYIQDGEGPEFDLDPWEESTPIDTNGIVGVRPESLRAHEQTVLGFDTRCLTSHRGCTTVAELLPTVWEMRKVGGIRCRLKNHEGWVECPEGFCDALR
jgi:hypothetical protein